MKCLSRIQVYGGKPLHGTITIQGSKNAALPMMAASLLHRGVSVLEACPKISDVFCMEEILQSLGAVTWWKDHDLYENNGFMGKKRKKNSKNFVVFT